MYAPLLMKFANISSIKSSLQSMLFFCKRLLLAGTLLLNVHNFFCQISLWDECTVQAFHCCRSYICSHKGQARKGPGLPWLSVLDDVRSILYYLNVRHLTKFIVCMANKHSTYDGGCSSRFEQSLEKHSEYCAEGWISKNIYCMHLIVQTDVWERQEGNKIEDIPFNLCNIR